ncbi:MAG: cytochrome c biogenesis CcdA family protein [Methanosarcina sp.]|jgi:cytochrome c-type biogenesis protein|nr:cytochrome c biogenesis CcdA family protein [Methanosarcina sp.]MDD4522682.1 cytochrome c biogenesis CcdA family protein [Methanosarcina sp.]HHV24414.1 cytochrome c biogenesis protein CcdA [Methanosarcina sp.]
MKKRTLYPLPVTKGILAFISIFLLLSPASGSAIPTGSRAASYFYGSENTIEVLLLENLENQALFFTPEFSYPLAGNREEKNKHFEKISPFLLLAAGILAGFNPCLLAVMAFLASVTLVQYGRRKEMLEITLGFSAGIFTMHMLAGMSILSVVNFLPEIQVGFIETSILLIALLGIWHIFDAYWLKKHAKSTFRTPEPLKRFMSRMDKNLLTLSFLSGSMFSLVKAPCVGAIYLSLLSILATKTDIIRGILYMGLYNFGLLLPVIGLGLLLASGLNPNKVTEFRERWRVEIRLTTGIILISVALLMQFEII